MLKIAGCLLTVAFTLYLAVMYDPVWLFDLVIAEVIFFAVCAVTGFCFARHIRVQFSDRCADYGKGERDGDPCQSREPLCHTRAADKNCC